MGANTEMAEYWDGSAGEHWVTEEAAYDQMLGPLGDRVLERLRLKPGRRILDVGCGTGTLSLAIAKRIGPRGEVMGVDVSGPMLGRARERADDAGLTTIDFMQTDAQTHDFPAARFDAIASRFGVMFFEDPGAAFRNLAAATRPGGRLVFVCWQAPESNEFLALANEVVSRYVEFPPSDPHAPGPSAFADPTRVHEVLGSAGWADVTLTAVEGTMLVPAAGPVDRAVAFTLKRGHIAALLAEQTTAIRKLVERDVGAVFEQHHDGVGVRLGYAAWLVEARRL